SSFEVGTHCGFCHTSEEEAEFRGESDETRAEGREMPRSMSGDRFSSSRDTPRHAARSIFKVARCTRASREIDFQARAIRPGMPRDRFSRSRDTPGHLARSIFKVVRYTRACRDIDFQGREMHAGTTSTPAASPAPRTPAQTDPPPSPAAPA